MARRDQRSAPKVLFLGPVTRVRGKKTYAFSTLQVEGGSIQLEYPSLQAAGAARGALAASVGAVVVPRPKLFRAIGEALEEARGMSIKEGEL